MVIIVSTGVNAADETPNLKFNTEGGYYEISSTEDMLAFASLCRSSKSPTCVGMTFKVTVGELDLGTDEFTRITGGFGGTFDGQGVVIKNMHKEFLFEALNGGTVKDVTLDSSCYLEGEKGNSIGGIAKDNNGGTISGCVNNANAKGYARTSGICNYNNKGTIIDCVNNGTIEGESNDIGGIVGYNEGGTITNCTNNGMIIGHGAHTGGIAGSNYGKNMVTIRNCTNTGKINSTSQDAGGIAGTCGDKSTIEDCINSGEVECTSYNVGGIAGSCSGIITGCQNSGSVSCGDMNVGGIAGTGGEIHNCTNSGNVSGEYNCGGISGTRASIYDSEVTGCTISSNDNLTAGAIIGTHVHGILSENYYYSDVIVIVNASKTPRVFDGVTRRGRGATGVSGKDDPEDLTEMEADGTMYYNCAVLKLRPGEVSFNLIYMVDGEVYKTYQVPYDDAITPEPAPTKEGYTFSGWSEIPSKMPANDVTVTGSFTINKYKLTYYVDGEIYHTYEVEYGTAITPEAAPEKEGYTFTGWEGLPTTMPANDVTATAVYTVNTYTLTYMVDGEVYTSYTMEYGASITPEAEPTKEGYTFSGWSEIPSTMPAEDVTITGTFIENREGPNLNYNEEGMFFEIASVEDMNTFSKYVNEGKTNKECIGWTFKVIVDELDYQGKEYVKIKDVFSGTFDGQGTTFKNLTYEALFYIIKDGIVENIIIGESCSLEGGNNVGGIATTNNGGTIIGCINNANASGNSRVSGIVNQNDHGFIRDCVNNGTITGTAANAAGIAGANDNGTIDGCANHGTIIGNGYCGGIVGSISNNGVVSNCENTGDIQSSGQDTGGIAGTNDNNCTIQGCTNTGKVESKEYFVGGIVGSSKGTVIECTNSGRITGKDVNNGGIAGANDGVIRKCINTGDVSGDSNCGGIAGRARGDIFDCLVSTCTIAAGSSLGAGAIIGGGAHGILSENYYESDVLVTVSSGTTTYLDATPRGIGASGVGGKKDPEDLFEMESGGTTYYNGAVLKGSSGISSIMQDSENSNIFTLDGKRVNNPQRGVYIIKNNGSTKKIMLK